MIENLFTFVRTLGNQRIEGRKFFTTQIGVLGTLSDGTGTVGTAGKVLSSTGSGVEWITLGGGTSNVADLDDLTDVVITTASSDQLLRFNGTSWVNWTPNFLTAYGSLNDLSDVTLTTPVNGARLIYSSSTSQWVDASPLGVNKIYYGTASGDSATTNVTTNGTRLSVGTFAMPTNLNVGQVDITTGIIGEGSIHIGGVEDEEVYLLVSRNKIQVGSQVVTFGEGDGAGEGGEGESTTTFTPSTLNIQPIGGQTVFGGLVTATGFKTPAGNNKQILLANGNVTSTNSATSGQILRWIESGGIGQWLADDENQNVPTLDEVTDAGDTTTNGITAGSFTTTGAISGGNITGTKVTTPTVEFNGAISTNSVEQVDQGDPNPNVFYAKWNGDVKFTVNGDGYAVAQTGYKVVGATGGFLKANGTIDTNTYLTSYTETQTLDAVTDLGDTTTNAITVGGLTSTSVTTPLIESGGLLIIDADTSGGLQPDPGDPAVPVLSFDWQGSTQGYIDTDGKITFNGFKTPSGTSSGFLKADGSIDTSTYLTSYTETQTLDAVTDLGSTTTNSIAVGNLSTSGVVNAAAVTTPLIERDGALTNNSEQEVEDGEPNPNLLYVSWVGNNKFVINADGYAIATTGYKVVGGTESGFLKANGTVDTNTYLTSYTETQTLDAVTDLGNTTTNTIDVGGITTPYVQFEEVEEAHGIARSINWSEDHNSLEVFYADEKHFDVGQDQMWYVKNGDEDTLLKGTVVMAIGAVGNSGKMVVAPLVADGTVSGRYAIGILMDDLRSGDFGFVMTQGKLRGIDTGEFTEGDTLYPDPETPGALVNVEPASPALKLPIAFVVSSHSNGAIAVRMTQGLDLHEVHDVQITDGANGQILRLETGVWTNWTPSYIEAETDPVFTASPAGSITTTNVSNWDSAYGWGDHASAGYLTSYENNYISDVRISESTLEFTGQGNAFNTGVDLSELPFAPVTHNHVIAEITGLETALAGKQPVGNYITTETDPTVPAHVKAITEDEIVNWNKAYDWGNHADAGYLTSFTETDPTVPAHVKSITATNISNWNTAYGWGNNYISDVRLTESVLSFTGSGAGFTGDIDLSTLPFAASSHTHTIADVTGLQTALDGKVPTTRTLTINGTALDLSADRSWTISSADGYISDVRLSESSLSFSGEGSAFTGDVDLSTLPFASSSHNHDDRYYTETESDSRFLNVSGDTITGKIALNDSAYFTGAPSHGFRWNSSNDAFNNVIMYDNGNMYVRGNVGIGTTAPQAPLHVIAASTNDNALIQEWSYTSEDTDRYSLMLKQTVTSGVVRYNFSMVNNGTAYNDVLVLDRGNVGIGTTTPATKLDVSGVITATGGNSTNWNTAYGWGNHVTAGYFKLEGTEPITIQAETVTFTGSIVVEGTITESSSIRFKENITPIDPALDKVNQLEAVSYNKIGVDDREIGLIAEDVSELFPEVVTYNEEGQPQGIQYQRLSVILLKAVQELTERVNKLENK